MKNKNIPSTENTKITDGKNGSSGRVIDSILGKIKNHLPQKIQLSTEETQTYYSIEAILETIIHIQKIVDLSGKGFHQHSAIVFDVIKFLKEYKKHGTLSEEARKKLSNFVTATLDFTTLDGMSHDIFLNESESHKSRYYRMTNAPQVDTFGIDYQTKEKIQQYHHILSKNEIDKTFSLLTHKNLQNIYIFDSWKDFLSQYGKQDFQTENNRLPRFFVKHLDMNDIKSAERAINTVGTKGRFIIQIPLGETSILWTHNMSEEGIVSLFPSLKDNHIHAPVSLPTIIKELFLSGISYPLHKVHPREQNVAIIRKGSNPLNETDIDNFFQNLIQKNYKNFSTEERAKIKRWGIISTQKDSKKFEEKTTEHYQKLFEVNQTRPEVLLTRSGTSANEAIMIALGNMLPYDAKIFSMEDWYFENQNTLKNHLIRTNNPQDAQAYAIAYANLDGSQTQEDFTKERDQNIKNIIQRASKNPNTSFYLILDKTINPLFSVFKNENLGNIPPNLTIVETASITKHQRGEKNYFFGIVNIFHNTELFQNTQNIIKEKGWNLTKEDVAFFPRITKTEIEKNQNHIKQLQNSFSEGFYKHIKELPESKQWQLTHNEFCTFINPPIQEILNSIPHNTYTENFYHLLRQATNENSPKRSIKNESLEEYINLNFLDIWKEIDRAMLAIERITQLIAGDSFGLDDTRHIFMKNSIMHYHKLTILLKNTEFLSSRISFGRKDSPEYTQKLGEKIGKAIYYAYNQK